MKKHKQKGHQRGIGSPIGIIIPSYDTQLYIDTENKKIYVATGLTTADWTVSTPEGGGVQ